MRLRFSPYLLLSLSSLFWAGNWIVGRGFRADLPPLALSFWRWSIALLLVLPFAWPHLARDWRKIRARWGWLALMGLLGIATYNTLAYLGLRYTTATNGLVLNSFIPIAIVALGWAFLGKRLAGVEALGILLSLAGVLVIVARGDPAVLAGLEFNIGDLWILVSVVVWAVYTLMLPRRPDIHPMSFLAAITAFGLAELAPAWLWEMSEGHHVVISLPSLAAIAYTGIFPGFLGFVCWNRGVAEVGPARAGLFIHLMPVFGVVLSTLFLGERPAPYHGLGIVLIFLGIWLNTREAIRRAP